MRTKVAVSIISALLVFELQTDASAQRSSTKAPPVIIETTPANERFGDWTVYPLGKGAFTTTRNESGSAFGILCLQGCTAFFNFQTSCEKGHRYPALINSSAGSFSVELECTVLDKFFLLAMNLNDTLVDSLSIGGELGVALPLESGRFQVARYSMTGGLRAASRALEHAKQRGGADQGKGLKDYTL